MGLTIRIAAVAMAGLPLLAPTAAASGPEHRASLVGMSRAALAEILGEPDEVKDRREGERLVYRLVEIDPDAPPVGVVPVTLPGLAPLGRYVDGFVPGDGESVGFEPAAIDEDGRLDGGGVSRQRSASGRLDDETGRFVVDPDPRAGLRGPATLRVELGADGRVASWTVKPRRLRRGGTE